MVFVKSGLLIVCPPVLLLFFNITLVFPGHLHFHINFRVNLSIFTVSVTFALPVVALVHRKF